MSIKAKLFVAILPLVIIPLLIIGWISYRKINHAVHESIITERANLLDQLTEQVKIEINTVEANVELFSSANLIQKYMLVSDEEQRYNLFQPALLKLLHSYQKAYPEYSLIRIFLPDGFEDTRSAVEGRSDRIEFGSIPLQFHQSMESSENIFASFFVDSKTGKPDLWVAKKINLIDTSKYEKTTIPAFRGMLAINTGSDFIDKFFRTLRANTKGLLFFVTKGNAILAGNQSQIIGREFSTDLLTRHIKKQSFQIKAGAFLNESSIVQYRQVRQDLFLVSMLPEKGLTLHSHELSRLLLVLTLGTICLSVIIMFFVLRWLILTPISTLSDTAREIGAGNLLIGMPLRSKDEIGDLGRTLKEMAIKLHSSKEKIAHLALYDELTGLPNRTLVKDYFTQLISKANRSNSKLALIFLDIDDFKTINDSYGHAVGDELLKIFSTRIQSSLRGGDIVGISNHLNSDTMVARLGGDEFLVLLSEITSASDVKTVCDRILIELAKPVDLKLTEVFLSTSMGIVVFPDDGKNVDTLLKNADTAMYEAKRDGKNCFKYFDKAMQTAVVEKITMANKLRRALENDVLELYYQPILDCKTLEIKAFEALSRWNDEDLGWVSPDIFIGIAEETGLILRQTEWMLEKAYGFWKILQQRGLTNIPISVNLSNIITNNDKALIQIEQKLRDMDFASQAFEIELTETCIMVDTKKGFVSLQKINEWGTRISIDDFGTGYSSLSYLSTLPVNSVKIDKSFVHNMTTLEKDHSIVTAIIGLAHNLGLEVTAEGVETSDQLNYLLKNNCDRVQGFYFSKALPGREAVGLDFSIAEFNSTYN